jgi:hypothetical protein
LERRAAYPGAARRNYPSDQPDDYQGHHEKCEKNFYEMNLETKKSDEAGVKKNAEDIVHRRPRRPAQKQNNVKSQQPHYKRLTDFISVNSQ